MSTGETTGDRPRPALGAAAELRREVQRLESTIMRRARLPGLVWGEMAAVVGVSNQAVHCTYGRQL